ncbi:hypothetical protein SAMN05216331_11338 [Porphyromonadaceae bacterium KH3R12]|nr:hypothetical protein SAMN05216331_11338 [Porphyromonadaceae bacterium KH3R12]
MEILKIYRCKNSIEEGKPPVISVRFHVKLYTLKHPEHYYMFCTIFIIAE